MKKVFICYHGDDYEIAKKLYDNLLEAGVIPWIDREGISPGQDREAVTRQAIKDSDFFVALFSKSSMEKKGFFHYTFKVAMKKAENKALSEVFIIPVRLENVDFRYYLDDRIGSMVTADLFPSYQKGLKALFKAMGIASIIISESKIVQENLIIRSIKFPEEYKQSGASILNYFSEILRKKYPDTNAKVTIEQQGLNVKMIIDPVDGDKEVIEKALNEYGLVVDGEMTPEEYCSTSPYEAMALKNKLKLAQTELRFLYTTKEEYEDQVRWMREHVGSVLQNQKIHIESKGNVTFSKDQAKAITMKDSQAGIVGENGTVKGNVDLNKG